MTTEEFSEAIQKLLEQEDIDQKVLNRLVIAIALDAQNRATSYHLHTNGELEKLSELINQQTKNIESITAVLDKHDKYLEQHPTIIYLLRYRTKETVATMLFLILILSLWYVSGIRQPILKFLGLPVF